MCGIAGLIYADRDRPVDPIALKTMGNAIAHRGPDAEGLLIEPGIGLVHRRLSIIDPEGGNQPIGNENGAIQVIFNGEIYNYRDQRRQLAILGHHFHTRTDTEVLVHLYEEWGARFVDRLRGMFAFALWDRPRGRLLLARDRLGIKPLYVYRDLEKLLFASELKAILAYGAGFDIAIDPRALEDYLAFGMVPGPRSIIAGIEKLPPAHVLEVQTSPWSWHRRRYWALRFEPDDRPTAEEWREEIRAKVGESVQAHLVADVPVGAFLSGGLDSSVVVALASDVSATPLRTFSIGFREEAFSELPYARRVAERFGTRHSEEIVTAAVTALLDELVFYFDEPFADPSAVPTFLVSRLASQGVKVVLSGDGGDEAFGGYSRYRHDLREAAIRSMLPGWFRRKALGPLAHFWPKADRLPRPLRVKTALTNLALDPDRAYANTVALCRLPLRRRLMDRDLSTTLDGYDPGLLICQSMKNAPPGDPLAAMIAADVATVLPDDFLVKIDRASMAHGLEVRPPLLDHELMELAARIPSRWKVRSGEGKWIFKRAFEDRLPPGIAGRRKQGFELPVDDWFRGPLRELFEASVLAPDAQIKALINQQVARDLYRDHLSGVGRHGQILWTLLVLAHWVARHLNFHRRAAPRVVV